MAAPRTTLVIGGTRNLGHDLVVALRAAGDRVTVLNRGITQDELPSDVERLRADRGDARAFAAALAGREFDAVVDTTLYDGGSARSLVDTLAGRIGRYLWLSSGQVYLVRVGLERPFREDDYDGPLVPEPPRDGPDWTDWRYGVEKRAAEDVLAAAWDAKRFPVTTLRLPMVNSRRDHFHRVLGYVMRLRDGGPILLPTGPHLALRHVDGDDVVRAIMTLLASGRGVGAAVNLSSDDTLSIEGFLSLLGEITGGRPCVVRVPRSRLLEARLLPACSPFSDAWMSALDNTRSRDALGIVYTPASPALERLVAWLTDHAVVAPGYAQRPRELALAAATSS